MSDSFAEEPRKQCRKVFELLVDVANDSEKHEDGEITCRWQGKRNRCLFVKLRLDALERTLIKSYNWKYEGKTVLRSAVRNLGTAHLGFSEKIQGTPGRGNERGVWKFITKELPSKNKSELVDYFDEQWQQARLRKNLPKLTKKEQNSRRTLKDIWYVNDEEVIQTIQASNGIVCEIFKLPCIEQDHCERGKRYNVTKLSERKQGEIDTQLRRHERVLQQLKGKKGIPENRAVFKEQREGEDYRWVVDEWIEGETLESLLEQGILLDKQLRKFSRSLLNIIHELHSADIILRDLCLKSIVISSSKKSKNQPFVVDFELAKMLTRDSTVSHRGLDDSPFRAPEMEEGDESPTRKSDLYSWAKVVIAAGTGNLEPTDDALLDCQGIPKKLYNQLERCINFIPDDRPDSAKEVLKALPFWY